MITAQTPLGTIEGMEGDGCQVFRGIRYAKAPVGERRFCPPEGVDPWVGTYDATEFGPSAPGPHMSGEESVLQMPVEPTDEDCLFLNVYTPSADAGKRPVLFWIHGGAYIMGSGRVYDGSAFAREHDVVVVTINYRLGMLGFLHVGHLDPTLAGSVNNAILDQVCALEWTRDNISAFGGDPGNVMIFGESAGGTSTAMLLGCPAAAGLFHKAAIHSPNVDLVPLHDGHVRFTDAAIRRLGGDPSSNGLATLRAATVDQLLALMVPDASTQASPPEPTLGSHSIERPSLAPVIDGTVIPVPIAEAIRNRTDNVPIIGGDCRHEGTLFSIVLGPDDFTEDGARELFAREGLDPDAAMAAYEAFAPGSTPHEKLIYALADTMFRNSMVRILDAQASSGAPCYSYMLTWETDLLGGELRATHALELPFLWDWIGNPAMEGMSDFAGSGAPQHLGPAMRAYWANFARHGVPSAEGFPAWQAYDLDERQTLILDEDIRMEKDFDSGIRKLWFS